MGGCLVISDELISSKGMKYGSTFWFLSTKLKEGVRQKGQGLRNRSLFKLEALTSGCIELL